MTLQEFLDRCREWEQTSNPSAGLAACDQLLAEEVEGRLLAAVLRYKAVFLLMSNQGWAFTAIGHLKDALDAAEGFPSDQAAILATLIAAYGMHGAYKQASQYFEQYNNLLAAHSDSDVKRHAPKIWFNFAYACEAAGKYDLASTAYYHAYRIAQDRPEVFNPGRAAHNLVQVALELGYAEYAIQILEESKAYLDEATVGSFMKNQEAWCLLALGRHEEAEAACREALAHPSCTERVRAEVLFTQARIHRAEGRLQEAEALSSEALEIALHMPHPRLMYKVQKFRQTLNSKEEVPES